MSAKDEDFLAQLRAVFNVEAAEHVQAMVTGLMQIERPSTPSARGEAVSVVFRAAHSLKGAARAIGLRDVESLCHSLEDLFAGWKRQDSPPTPAEIDDAHRSLTAVSAALALSMPAAQMSKKLGNVPSVPDRSSGGPVARAAPAGGKAAGRTEATSAAAERGSPSPGDTVRIAVSKLDEMLVQAEELFAAKLAAMRHVEEMRELEQRFDTWKHEWAEVESDAQTLRQLVARPMAAGVGQANDRALGRLLDFADWSSDYLKSIERHTASLARSADQDRHVIDRLVDDLLESSKNVLLLPFATSAAPFPKLVRDLCRDQGKDAELVIRGEDVTIDKRILEEIKDPLIHLLRNAVDHGIESPERRAAARKPPRASITINVTPVEGSKVEVTVSDDGAGIDLEKLKTSAIQHGHLLPADALTLGDAEARKLALQPDVSTSPMITTVSGRGLGLAIVRERAEMLGGSVSVESEPGRGTSFCITVPARLATFRGILIEAAERRFIVPTAHVEQVARVKADDVRTVEGRETIALGGRAIARARLADVLELPAIAGGGTASAMEPTIVVFAGDQRVALAVDAVLGEQEVLVKRFSLPLVRVRNVSGATVLASGQVVPVLNVADLLKSSQRNGGAAARSPALPKPSSPVAKAILVVEDSITSRTMIKSILESAGHRVETAVDGMDALTKLRSAKFDLVVSDVEMPRLNGLDLTARIRADKRLADLPVVLLTARETREDRERGIDVGANAYLVKSGFDQDDLLDAVRRLA